MRNEILPYYHPTTVVLVDDNENFLKSFSLQLPEDLSWMTFTSARSCLEFLNRPSPRESLEKLCLSLHNSQPGRNHNLIRMDFTLIEQEISNPSRFTDISVLIVDYDMPEMDGLELCRRIENPRIKKILLTGVADEKIAVNAFNDGLIDRFFMKNEPDIGETLNMAIQAMQRAYFKNISTVIQNALALKAPDFLYDPEFIAFFEKFYRENRIVEYYYVEDPRGILLVGDNGSLTRLVVFSESELEQALFQLRGCNAPEYIIRKVSSNEWIPCLWGLPDHPAEQEDFDWDEFIYPAERLKGQRSWLYALVTDPPADIEYDPATSSYSRYLEKLRGRHF